MIDRISRWIYTFRNEAVFKNPLWREHRHREILKIFPKNPNSNHECSALATANFAVHFRAFERGLVRSPKRCVASNGRLDRIHIAVAPTLLGYKVRRNYRSKFLELHRSTRIIHEHTASLRRHFSQSENGVESIREARPVRSSRKGTVTKDV